MGALLIFIYKASVVMLAIYAIYKLLLARVRRPRFCRVVLLSTYMLAPLAVWLSGLDFAPAEPQAQAIAVDTVLPAVAAPTVDAEPLWPRVLLWIWLAGVTVTAIFMLMSMARVGRLVASCRRRRHIGRVRLAVTDDRRVAPFSFGRTIVVNHDDLAADGSMIMAHELQHIELWHSVDLVLARIAAVIMWFNPAAWMLVRELSKVHEFEVDGRVIRTGIDIRRYQYMLIGRAVGYNQVMMVNGLNHSSIRQRIIMMQQPCGPSALRWLVVSLLPVALAASMFTSRQAFLADIAHLSFGSDEAPSFVEPEYFGQLDDIVVVGHGITLREAPEPMQEVAEAAAPVAVEQPAAKAEPAVVSEEAVNKEEVVNNTEAADQSQQDVVAYSGNVSYSRGRVRQIRAAGTVSTPYYYIDGDPYERLPKDLDQSKIESITIRRDHPNYPDGVIYITMKHE